MTALRAYCMKTFTGITRRKQTPFSVRLGDIVSRWLITVGGIGTIVAVSAVFVFLGYVVMPMFLPASIDAQRTRDLALHNGAPLRLAVDEYGVIGWTLSPSGKLSVFRADTGELLDQRDVFPKAKLTATAFMVDAPNVAAGFEDGTVRLGHIMFRTSYVSRSEVPENIRDLPVGQPSAFQGGVVERTPQEQFRLQKVETKFADPVPVAHSPIVLIDQVILEGKSFFCVLTGAGQLQLNKLVERKNLLTDEVVVKTQKNDLPYKPHHGKPAKYLRLSGHGDSILVAWEDGHAVRVDARDLSQPVIAEQLDLVTDPTAKLTAMEQLIGRRTIVIGDSNGNVVAWFGVRFDDSPTSDGVTLTRAHEMPAWNSAVTALAASSRTRLVMAGYHDGQTRLFQVTAAKTMVDVSVGSERVAEVAIGPKDDQLYALTKNQLWAADLDPKYPEVSFTALFRPVWYEDYPRPEHVWQSTGGTSDFEPKLGLWPLIFGTLKATFYSMLFGAPLALLAAIYTSEFMHPRWRNRVKPSIELMASLPSVVLGFLAGNVLAHRVEGIVPHVLTAFFLVPGAILLGAFMWQLLPQRRALRMQWLRLPLIGLAAVLMGMGTAWLLGPVVERWLFAGNIMHWLDGQIGSGFGGWMLLFSPLSALVTAILVGRYANPWLQSLDLAGRRELALANLAKFVVGCLAAFLGAMAISGLMTVAGFDPRGSYVDTYIQRNALIVGFIMGFAIIPIIYTIAEDALSTVPEHLRSASLGSGATHWQTAVRIVVPTAMSGLFSAVMIGLGRAVGETMIVLMAAGNTPVMKMNIFDGFRTLSANIAVELPEAPRDGTHYRVLFLAALTLFVMTFVVNTIAEIVRLRFRRRAYQL
jgi:phosphate transport system permease protein